MNYLVFKDVGVTIPTRRLRPRTYPGSIKNGMADFSRWFRRPIRPEQGGYIVRSRREGSVYVARNVDRICDIRRSLSLRALSPVKSIMRHVEKSVDALTKRWHSTATRSPSASGAADSRDAYRDIAFVLEKATCLYQTH